jgi:uncharacterized coiled-coil DUF342 family protein
MSPRALGIMSPEGFRVKSPDQIHLLSRNQLKSGHVIDHTKTVSRLHTKLNELNEETHTLQSHPLQTQLRTHYETHSSSSLNPLSRSPSVESIQRLICSIKPHPLPPSHKNKERPNIESPIRQLTKIIGSN